ncbi:hypothetical protein [Thiothrix winogradskyi]|uniref:Arc-like DNA binding domain-containing protein n=1 Tax=Thiothrix winogradskyi TaxID=96472 RepID=A0ABY3SVV0_9GAMM|nr:hypothetical protein [Thiothrix winogradskyi]UJS23521.1 hypothetical protein L2Y54_16450 [Thiothrix winogradskyi]
MKEMQQKSYPLRLEPELKQWVKEKAKAEDRSFNAQINRFIKKIKEIEEVTEQKQAA